MTASLLSSLPHRDDVPPTSRESYRSPSPMWSKGTTKLSLVRSILGKPFAIISGFTHFFRLLSYHSSPRFSALFYPPVLKDSMWGQNKGVCLVLCILNKCLNHFQLLFLTSSLMMVFPVFWVISASVTPLSHRSRRVLFKECPSNLLFSMFQNHRAALIEHLVYRYLWQ